MNITIPSFTITIDPLFLTLVIGLYIAASIWVVFWIMIASDMAFFSTPNPLHKKYYLIFFPGCIFWTIVFGTLSTLILIYQKLTKTKFAKKN